MNWLVVRSNLNISWVMIIVPSAYPQQKIVRNACFCALHIEHFGFLSIDRILTNDVGSQHYEMSIIKHPCSRPHHSTLGSLKSSVLVEQPNATPATRVRQRPWMHLPPRRIDFLDSEKFPETLSLSLLESLCTLPSLAGSWLKGNVAPNVRRRPVATPPPP